jgi:hypothetical protein
MAMSKVFGGVGTVSAKMRAVQSGCCADVDRMAAALLVSMDTADVGADPCDVYNHSMP